MADRSDQPPEEPPAEHPLGARPFAYKPRALLEPSERLLKQMHRVGQYNLPVMEAASILGCSKSTLERFWKDHPEYLDAYEDGKHARKVRLRMLLDNHAITDAPTARFQAKNELGMSDDPSKARADEAAAALTNQNIDRAEQAGRILELQKRLSGGRTVYGETAEAEQSQGPGVQVPGGKGARPLPPVRQLPPAAPAQQAAGAAGGGDPRLEGQETHVAGPGGRSERRDAQLGVTRRDSEGRPVGGQSGGGKHATRKEDQVVRVQGGPGADGAARPVAAHRPDRGRVAQGHAEIPEAEVRAAAGKEAPPISEIAARLAELEASVVRKNPRKDGQPHTDRTKPPLDNPANRPQTSKPEHIPGRLPGRLGKL